MHGLLTHRDLQRCKIIQRAVQDVNLDIFLELKVNDFLFIDSSHVAKIGSDVLHLMFTVLPRYAVRSMCSHS